MQTRQHEYISPGQRALTMALSGVRHHPDDKSGLSAAEFVGQLLASLPAVTVADVQFPAVSDDVLFVLADELELALLRCQHVSYAKFYEYQRVQRGLSGPIVPCFEEDGLYHRPCLEPLKALVVAVQQVTHDLAVLRACRKMQFQMKAEGIVDWQYDEGIR